MTGRVLQRCSWCWPVPSPWSLSVCLLAWCLVLVALVLLVYSPSPSLPTGLYLRALPLHALRLGDLVVLTPPEVLRPTLPVDHPFGPLLKEVAGLTGTHVCWNATRMVVQLPGEERHYRYASPYPVVPQMVGCRVLEADEMLVVGRHARSVDSRYVGPVKRELVRFRVWPLWTQEAP